MDSTSLAGKVFLVTGAASGIGQATALELARRGADVAVADTQDDGGLRTTNLIKELGRDSVFVRCDISKESDVKNMMSEVLKKFGRLNGAFNNAGIEGESHPTHDFDLTTWQRILDINLTGTWLCMKHEIPELVRQGGGVIVNCSSIAGVVGFQGSAAYVASKHGVMGLTKAAALDYASSNIRINAVCPGVIQTPMITRFTKGAADLQRSLEEGAPMKRVGQPDEIASGVAWLMSPGSTFMTGQSLVIDGGWTVS